MNFCQEHWDLLRGKIEGAGLMALVADGGLDAAQKMTEQLQGAQLTLSNYDPLMAAMFALAIRAYDDMGPNNAKRVILEGHCPICVVQHVHDLSCEEEICEKKFIRFFDNAVAEEVERSKKLLGGGG